MSSEIVIEQMEISEKAKVLGFLKNAYSGNPRHSDPEYWNWHFVSPPHSESGGLPIWLAKSGDRIAGQMATLPVELNIGEKKVKALWALDFIVDPDFRRRGIGKKLAMAAEEFSPYLLGVNTDRQHAPALLKGLGWKVVSKIPRFHKILFPGEAFTEISRIKPLRNIANLAFAPFRSGSRGYNNDDVRILENFDASFDDLWDRSRRQWPCSISRNTAELDWQFRRQPGKKFVILGYYKNQKLHGYAVLFFRKKNSKGAVAKAAISDICYHPEDAETTVDALLLASLRLVIEKKAGGLVTDAMDPLLEKRLRHFGFWKVNSPLQLMAKAPKDHELLYDRREWFLTRGDSDISIFEHPNL